MAQDGIDAANEAGGIIRFLPKKFQGLKEPPPRLLYVPDLLIEYVTYNGLYYLVTFDGYIWFSMVGPNGPYGQGPEENTYAGQRFSEYQPSPKLCAALEDFFREVEEAG